jgi:outer membrane protein assembly factor BamB
MAIAQTDASTPRQPLRLWPGVVLVILQWLIKLGAPIVAPDAGGSVFLAGLALAALVLVWWLFFSRAPWVERLGAVGLMVVGVLAAKLIVHESIAEGAMGMLLPIMSIPVLCLGLVGWAAATRGLAAGPRRIALVAVVLIACGSWALVRTGGFTGGFENDLHWRWTQTPEERLLAQADETDLAPATPGVPVVPAPANNPEQLQTSAGTEPTLPAPAAVISAPAASAAPVGAKPAPAPAVATAPAADGAGADWPGFRGPRRDGAVRGVRIATDWAASPPVELWRRPIGPGWSSFAVHGDLVYTQEQRGEDEVVSCYNATTGEPVWRHTDAARFWESNAGAGPRGTPTLADGRIYALGATGILNALDAGTGAVVWSRNAAEDSGAKLPGWGFSGSPLVVGDVVLVPTSGALAAYDAATGAPRWSGLTGGEGYSSPQLVTIAGVPQILMLNGAGLTSLAPADGKVLWEHAWKGYPIVQPALTAEGDILISVSDRGGLRRLAVARGPGGWTAEERWTSIALKPYFNDFVVHKGHAYGFDGSMLAGLDVGDGKRRWKGGRYGHGQLVLLADQDLLLVLSEKGELALVKAAPDQFTELARLPAIEGKTWNHPVLAGDLLLVRNDQEMVAFRLARAAG